jgi:hypothetical protein
MKTIALTLLLSSFAVGAAMAADEPTCAAQATEKKLAGAARTSFMGACEKRATAACEATAAEKKYAGAVKTSFTTSCIKKAVGEP